MSRVVRSALTCMAASMLAVLAADAVAEAGTPMRAREHLDRLVNETRKEAVVRTVCAGPIGSTSTGQVAGRQSLSVVRVQEGGGYTGLFDAVYAWFQPTGPGTRPTQLRFTHFSTRAAIPTSIRVPCRGPGRVVFSSCPYLAPCAAGWVTDDVKVRFEAVAASHVPLPGPLGVLDGPQLT
jgi:hypothetical protein